MPIYEYCCQQCGQCTEILQKVSDSAPTDCSYCGASALKKQISNTSFRLTGDGWYVTDFKNSGKKTKIDKESEKSSNKD
jgi:putative FmdB family regulatory protein